jgi:hypothetical protein
MVPDPRRNDGVEGESTGSKARHRGQGNDEQGREAATVATNGEGGGSEKERRATKLSTIVIIENRC